MALRPLCPDRIGIYKCWFLRRGENRSTRRKTSRSKDEKQQQTQPTSDAEPGTRTRATLVGGECSHHCAVPALLCCIPMPSRVSGLVDATSSPGLSPRSKWRSEKPLAKAAQILQESWSILSRDTWWNGFFGGCFQRMAALFVFCNRKPLFKRNEDISSCFRDEILTNFLEPFSSLGQGFLRPPFWTRRRTWGRGCGWRSSRLA